MSNAPLPPEPRLILGHAIPALRHLPAGSVQCVVTSIPYWGLRVYQTALQAWGGDPECVHAFGEPEPAKRQRWGSTETMNEKQASNRGAQANVAALELASSAYCTLCGAWQGEWGSEPTVGQYVTNTVAVCREIRRVLRPHGCFWLNLGDNYIGAGGQRKPWDPNNPVTRGGRCAPERPSPLERLHASDGLKALDLSLAPFRVALALQDDGWFVRQTVIWHKPNPMPHSVSGWEWVRHRRKIGPSRRLPRGSHYAETTAGRPQGSRKGRDFDSSAKYEPCAGCTRCERHGGYVLSQGSGRPVTDHEYILLLTKSSRYYYDVAAVREAFAEGSLGQLNGKYGGQGQKGQDAAGIQNPSDVKRSAIESMKRNGGRNQRSVWRIKSEPFVAKRLGVDTEHFASYPLEIPRRAVLASTSAAGECPHCGMPWARVTEPTPEYAALLGSNAGADADRYGQGYRKHSPAATADYRTLGWRQTCKCPEHQPIPQTVLDPCCGSGTTLRAAKLLGRASIGIDLNPDYLLIAAARCAAPVKAWRVVKKRVPKPAQPLLLELAP